MMENINKSESFEHVSTIMQPSTPVKWTPEDAANFIASTIKEAQKPTVLAIKKRGVAWWVYLLTVLILLAVIAGCIYYFMWMRDSEWNGRELQWREKEAKLSRDYTDLKTRYDQIVDRKLDMAVEIASDAVDNTQITKMLESARKEIGAGEANIEKLSLRLKDISSQNVDLSRERDEAVKEAQKIKEELLVRKSEIQNIDDMKLAHQKEINKLQKHLSLSKQVNAQQKEEIKLLRTRLNTLQEMVGNLGGDGAKLVAPAVNSDNSTDDSE